MRVYLFQILLPASWKALHNLVYFKEEKNEGADVTDYHTLLEMKLAFPKKKELFI